jgi:mutator protein MutT
MPKRVRVVAALIEKDGRFLIAQRGGNDSFAGKWEFPGGKVREGERDEEALQREIREELGVEIGVGAFEAETEHAYPELSVHLLFYRCDVASGIIERSADHEALAWVTPQEMERYDFLQADRPVLRFLARRASPL